MMNKKQKLKVNQSSVEETVFSYQKIVRLAAESAGDFYMKGNYANN